MRVLIVEDEPYLAQAIRDGLRLEAIAADIAGDGDAALELLSVNAYDIAVLDRDIPGPSGDEVAQRIMVVAQRIGRAMRGLFAPQRVGYLVHGYGVAHAHLVLVPQHGPYHLTSDRFARIEDGRVVFDLRDIPLADRATLDEQARALAAAMAAASPD